MSHGEDDAPAAPATFPAPVRLVVDWEGDRRYRGGRPGSPGILIDAAWEQGPGAVDTVVVALASCAAIDVVDILAKRRTPARSLRITADYLRAEGRTPRRLTEVRLTFHVATDSTIEHVRRAVTLSVEKYCSVAASLAPDIRMTADAELAAGAPALLSEPA